MQKLLGKVVSNRPGQRLRQGNWGGKRTTNQAKEECRKSGGYLNERVVKNTKNCNFT